MEEYYLLMWARGESRKQYERRVKGRERRHRGGCFMVRGDSATSGEQNGSSQADSPLYSQTTLSIKTINSDILEPSFVL